MATRSSTLESPLEVLPSLLLWGTELAGDDVDSDITYVDALELSAQDGQINGYYVQHYQEVPGAWGQAHGPFALDQTLRFCRRLKARLASFRCGKDRLCLTTRKDNEDHTNAVVLLGAYLILVEDWSANAVAGVLGNSESQRKLPCAWAKLHVKESSWLMRVMHCWEGLEVAKLQGWIDTKCLIDDELTEQYCKEYRSIVATYDAAWIIPGELLVSADPVTVACDPNPETFDEIFASGECSKGEGESGKGESDSTLSPQEVTISTASTEQKHSSPMPADRNNEPLKWQDPLTPASVNTVCKDYVESSQRLSHITSSSETRAYSSFLQDCDVSLVIRVNFSDEPGMPRPSYDAKQWDRFGVRHKDIQFEDRAGGLPLASSVADLFAAHKERAKNRPGAVLIHCKGGFGRSVILCCCLGIYHHNVPGSALLGWCRIVRPGAITTPQQEAFLLSMKSRADLIKFMGKARISQASLSGEKVTCGCIVQ